jgi:hypothetical protein
MPIDSHLPQADLFSVVPTFKLRHQLHGSVTTDLTHTLLLQSRHQPPGYVVPPYDWFLLAKRGMSLNPAPPAVLHQLLGWSTNYLDLLILLMIVLAQYGVSLNPTSSCSPITIYLILLILLMIDFAQYGVSLNPSSSFSPATNCKKEFFLGQHHFESS